MQLRTRPKRHTLRHAPRGNRHYFGCKPRGFTSVASAEAPSGTRVRLSPPPPVLPGGRLAGVKDARSSFGFSPHPDLTQPGPGRRGGHAAWAPAGYSGLDGRRALGEERAFKIRRRLCNRIERRRSVRCEEQEFSAGGVHLSQRVGRAAQRVRAEAEWGSAWRVTPHASAAGIALSGACTVRLKKGLPSLRGRREQAVLVEVFRRGSERFGFRLVHYSVQSNHAHFVVEARSRDELSCGMGGLATRIARGLNGLWGRRGRVFADRYHDQILRTPRQVRNALRYVLNKARRHKVQLAGTRPDPCSSGRWFDGWRDWLARGPGAPVARARTWLLRVGWRRHRLIGLCETPGG